MVYTPYMGNPAPYTKSDNISFQVSENKLLYTSLPRPRVTAIGTGLLEERTFTGKGSAEGVFYFPRIYSCLVSGAGEEVVGKRV